MASSFDNKFSQYEPVDDSFSSKELNRSLWFVSHKQILKNFAIATVLVADIMLFGYAISGFVEYFLTGQQRENAIVSEIAERLKISTVKRIETDAAAQLEYGEGRVYTFDSGDDRYDFAVEVKNPNRDWYVLLTYRFDIDGASSTPTRTMFILPGENKFLTVLGVKREGEIIGDATLNITNSMWSRIDKHAIADTEQFLKDHASFNIVNPEFKSAVVVVGNEDTVENTGNQITFNLVNTSAYNFWDVPVQIALMRAGSLEGIEETHVKDLKTGESRLVDIRNYIKNQLVDEVLVIPSVDVFDPSVYKQQ